MNKDRLFTILGFIPPLYLVLFFPIAELILPLPETVASVIAYLYYSPVTVLILDIISVLALIEFRYDRTKLYMFIRVGCGLFIFVSVILLPLLYMAHNF